MKTESGNVGLSSDETKTRQKEHKIEISVEKSQDVSKMLWENDPKCHILHFTLERGLVI